MTRANPGAKIKDPKTDWEWKALKLGENERACVDCGQPFIPTGRVQKYCLKCKANHRGWKHYETVGEKKYKPVVKRFMASDEKAAGHVCESVEDAQKLARGLKSSVRADYRGQAIVELRGKAVVMRKV